MVEYDLRTIDPDVKAGCYNHEEICEIRATAQCEMLRCSRQRLWCKEQRTTLELIGIFLLVFFLISNFIALFIKCGVLVALAAIVIALHIGARQADYEYRYAESICRDFSEVDLEHYNEIDQLCHNNTKVADYIDQIGSLGRVLTYYELRMLVEWAEANNLQSSKRRPLAYTMREKLLSFWGRRHHRPVAE